MKIYYYVFNVLFLSKFIVVYIFMKVFGDFVNYLRVIGMKIIFFLDDGIGFEFFLS